MKGPERTPICHRSPDTSSGSASDQYKSEHVSNPGDTSAIGEDRVREHLKRFLAANPPDDWTEKGFDVEKMTALILEEDEVLRGFVETNLQLYEQVKEEYPDQNIDEWWWNSTWWWPWR
jgi:hypothetical protein